MPRFVVELEEDDLLPRSQSGTAVDDREGEARSEERGADVAVAVSVVPTALVPVLDRRREEPIQRTRDVFVHESRFELVGDNRTRRRWREDAGEAVADTGSFNHFRHAVRDVDRLNPSAGLEWNRLPVSDHGAGIPSAEQEGIRGALQSQPCFGLASVDPPLPPGKERGREGRSPPCGGDRPKPSRGGVGWGGGLF